MGDPKPTMFIGSSSGKGQRIAEMIKQLLADDVDCTVWHQGVFGLSGGTLETLDAAVDDYDFATLVLTPDDLLEQREIAGRGPRDNVLFELGLFMGALGRKRTFIVHPRTKLLLLPTDLAGITTATFKGRGDLPAALGPVCTMITQAMEEQIEAQKFRPRRNVKARSRRNVKDSEVEALAWQKETRKAYWNKLKGIIGGATDLKSYKGALKELFKLLPDNMGGAPPPVIRLWGGNSSIDANYIPLFQKIGKAIGRCCAINRMSLSGSHLEEGNLEYWAALGAKKSLAKRDDFVRLYLHYNRTQAPYTDGSGHDLYKGLRATIPVIDVRYSVQDHSSLAVLNNEINHQKVSHDARIGSLLQCDAILLLGGNEAARHCIQLTAFISRHHLRAAKPIVFVPLPWVGGTAETAFRAFNGLVEDLDYRLLTAAQRPAAVRGARRKPPVIGAMQPSRTTQAHRRRRAT